MFKIGNKVKIINSGDSYTDCIGYIVKIKTDNSLPYSVNLNQKYIPDFAEYELELLLVNCPEYLRNEI